MLPTLQEGHITDEEAKEAYDTPIDEGLIEQTTSDNLRFSYTLFIG